MGRATIQDHPNHEVARLTDEQRQHFEAREEAVDGPADVLTFGKYKGKSLAWVKEKHPSYFLWIYQERRSLFTNYKWLRQAILDAGIFSEELSLLEDQADDQARLVIDGWQGVAAASQDGALADEVGVESPLSCSARGSDERRPWPVKRRNARRR